VEAGQVYDIEKDGKKIIPNIFYGSHFNDELMFLDPSTSQNGQPTLKSKLDFMSVTTSEKPFSTQYDGFVGIAPFADEQHPKQYNFLYQMKYNAKVIDHLIAGLQISKND
jgi:hypothetical protein